MKEAGSAGPRRHRTAIVLLIAAAAPASVLAQGKVDTKLMQRVGGVLAPECARYELPQLVYAGDSIIVREGGKAVLTGRHVRTVAPAPAPAGFEGAVSGDVGGGETMTFVFTRDANGVYATVEGGPRVMAALPAALRGKRVRHCDPNRNAVAGAPPPAIVGPDTLVADPAFKRAWLGALGARSREPWLARMDGPAPPVRPVRVAGQAYQLVSVCKNHDCADNNLVLLWAAPGTIYARLLERGRPVVVGNPPPAVADELERLWRAEWRKGR